MAQKLRRPARKYENRFPPEASADFDVVDPAKIAEWRKELCEEFGIGQGRLTVVDEPA